MPRPALSPNSSRICVARTFAGAVAVALAAAAPASAAASTLACGDTLPAGHFVLETDLVCASCPGVGVGLYLTSGAHLDMNGHSISFTTGGCGTGLSITGDGAHVENGRLFGGDVGIQIDGGGGHSVTKMHVDTNNWGVIVNGSSGNDITQSDVSGNYDLGIKLVDSPRNTLRKLVVNDTFGTGLDGGIFLTRSDENDISHCEVARSYCRGISLFDSSRNTVCHNAVRDSKCLFGKPAANIALTGASLENLVCKNQVSATEAGTADGINVGCKGDCGFQGPTTGANDNSIVDNTADSNDLWGIAQATGNTGNVYVRNEATGNGVADYAIDP